MTERMSVAEYRRLQGLGAPEPAKRPGGRYGKRRHGQHDSRAEAAASFDAGIRTRAGELVGTFPQVSIPYGTDEKGRRLRYFADRLDIRELLPDDWFIGRFVDVKGVNKDGEPFDTPLSLAKRAALRGQGLPIAIELK